MVEIVVVQGVAIRRLLRVDFGALQKGCRSFDRLKFSAGNLPPAAKKVRVAPSDSTLLTVRQLMQAVKGKR